jgi:hypothetical protein
MLFKRSDRRDDYLSGITTLSNHPVTPFSLFLITARNAAAAPVRGRQQAGRGTLIHAQIVPGRDNYSSQSLDHPLNYVKYCQDWIRRIIHKAKDLSPDQKIAIENLVGRSIAEDEAISILRWRLRPRRNGCGNPGRAQSRQGWIGSLPKRSMQKSTPRGRHCVIASSPRSNDPGCRRHQHPDFRPAQSARTASAGASDDHHRPTIRNCA